ncbi:MAG: chorismate mutase [Clostridia bacterium]|nr:chorismate mutase [Clostridia bacterium]
MNELDKARQIINDVDREMAALFEKRMEAARTVAFYKKENGIPVTDTARDKEVINRNAALVENEELRSYYINFLRNNMELSKAFQHRLLEGMRVSFSGVAGAFAGIAAKKVFPDAIICPHSDFKSAYDSVVNGECDCVILPIENSHNGDVGQVMDLAFFGSLYINGIYDISIVQNLLALKGATLDGIKEVISHPQALGQCADYIKKHGFKAIEAVNTAVAAKTVAESARYDIAAIGSDEAAEEYGLKKLESHINEANNNTTRFAVFSRTKKAPSHTDGRFIMMFTVRNEAGALGKAISVIGQHGFNLRALKSRPTKELIWDYYFYVEGEGNIHTPEGEAMLNELQNHCSAIKVIGNFEKEMIL